jgi:hypothetical protein
VRHAQPPFDFAPRGEVLRAALSTSVGLAIAGAGLRNVAALAAARGWSAVPDLAARMPLPGLSMEGSLLRLAVPEPSHAAWALAAAAGVTAARLALMSAWPDFRAASDAANQQARARVHTTVALAMRSLRVVACADVDTRHARARRAVCASLLQVLPALSVGDVLLVALVTGVSEARPRPHLRLRLHCLRACA